MSPRSGLQFGGVMTNLNSWLDNSTQEPKVEYILIGLLQVFPGQPRKYFDPEAMQSLVESVRNNGILQPILVRPLGDKFEVIAGERRYRAAVEVGLKEVPAIARAMSETEALKFALTENMQRDDLNPVDEAEGVVQLLSIELGVDKASVIVTLNRIRRHSPMVGDNVVAKEEEVIAAVFKSVGKMSAASFQTHRLPLLNLPEDVKQAVRTNQIEYTKARAIAQVEDEVQRQELLNNAIEFKLSLSEIKQMSGVTRHKLIGDDAYTQINARIKSFNARIKTFKKKDPIWQDSKKFKQLEKLLSQMDKLLGEESMDDGSGE